MTQRSVLVLSLAVLLLPGVAAAHCDTLDGPVVADARSALEAGDLAPVLKWIDADDEAELGQAFASALKVRALGPAARDLSDRHFFETLVRLHRASEGAPYTGLKPAGSVPPPIAAADRALETGSADELIGRVQAEVAETLRARFAAAKAARAHAEHNPTAGRSYVDSYVAWVHTIENLHHALAAAEHAGSADQHAH